MVPRTRREALRAAGSALAALGAGCLGADRSGGAGEPTDEPTPRPVDDPEPTGTPPTTDGEGTAPEPTGTPPPEAAEGVSVAWEADLGGILSRPAVADGTVYVATAEGPVYAVDSGEVAWRFPEGGSRWHAPTVAGGTVYVGGDETLYALDAADGTERWRHEWAGNMTSSPAVAGDTLVVGNTDRPTSHTESEYPEDLWGLSRGDGAVTWKRDLATGEELSGTPVLAGGTLYAQTWASGLVYALDPASGEVAWKRELGTSNGPPAFDGGRLFVAANDGVVALDPATGDRRWRVGGVETAPVAGGGTVYAGSWETTATVRAFDAADGGERWTFERDGELRSWSALAATSSSVLVNVFHEGGDAIDDNTTALYGLDGTSGDVAWRFVRRSGEFARPTPAGDRVYVGSAGGALYALRPG